MADNTAEGKKKKRKLLLLLLLLLFIGLFAFIFLNGSGNDTGKKDKKAVTTSFFNTGASDNSGSVDSTDNEIYGGDLPMADDTTTEVLGISTSRTPTPGQHRVYPTTRPRTPTPAPTQGPNPTNITPTPTFPPQNPFAGHLRFNQNLKGTLSDNEAIDVENTGVIGQKNVMIKFRRNSKPLAEVSADFSADRNWSSLNSGFLTYKSFIHGLVGQAGAGSSFALYVPIPEGRTSNSVIICPGANDTLSVKDGCPNEQIKFLGDPGVTKITNAYGTFWRVTGLTGTGGASLLEPFDVKDTMSRLKISTVSDHVIDFGTINGLLLPTDSMVVDFGTQWNFGSLSVDDIDLLDDGVNVNLAATAAADTWGVNIDNVNSRITFTPPTSGSGYILEASLMQLKIGANASYGVTGSVQITNPTTVNGYNIGITLTDALGEEDATIGIPIVDDDQVNITGFVNTSIMFDIDTAILQSADCNYNTCLTHEYGATAGTYTVDLGELNATYVNESNTIAVMHAQGGSGLINSIYFDLTTNSLNGAVVTVRSTNSGLLGPGPTTLASVAANGDPIAANSGRYGFTMPDTATGDGTIVRNAACSTGTAFCRLISTPNEVFNTGGIALEIGRVRMDIAAAATYVSQPGNYTDTLTFVATANY